MKLLWYSIIYSVGWYNWLALNLILTNPWLLVITCLLTREGSLYSTFKVPMKLINNKIK